MRPFVLANGEGGVGVQTAVDAVVSGSSALDAREAGIRVVEIHPSVRTVGFGGAPNLLGQMECDAAIMCGESFRTGAVGALKDVFHAISVARQVMERTPHAMIVGEGAGLFAAEIGERKGNLLSDESRVEYEHWLREHVPTEVLAQWPNVSLANLLWPSAKPETARGTTCFT